MTPWLRAFALVLAFLALEFAAQGWIEWRAIQAGFQRELPRTVCCPTTGREIPVCVWDECERRK